MLVTLTTKRNEAGKKMDFYGIWCLYSVTFHGKIAVLQPHIIAQCFELRGFVQAYTVQPHLHI